MEYDLYEEITGDDYCDHCASEKVTTENGTNLCEYHLNEYRVRNGM